MPLIAVNGCTLQDAMHQGQCTIKAGLAKNSKIDGNPICLDELEVIVAGGTIPGAQVAPVTVKIKAAAIVGTKFEGKAPVAVGDMNTGGETGKYQVGNSVQEQPIVITVADAGQTAVQAT